MDSNVLIVGIVVLGIVVIVVLLKDRITSLFVKASSDSASVNVKTAEPAPSTAESLPPNSVNYSDNASFGSTDVEISRPNTNVSENLSVGKTNIKITKDDPKSKK